MVNVRTKSWRLMGQPSHPLTAHVGKTQLWENGVFTEAYSVFWGPHIYRVNVLIRVLALFFAVPILIPNENMWHSKLSFLSLIFFRSRRRDLWVPKPDYLNSKRLFVKYFRETPLRGLFMDGDQLVTEDGFLEKRLRTNLLVGKTKLFVIKTTTVLLFRCVVLRHLRKVFPRRTFKTGSTLNLNIKKFKLSMTATAQLKNAKIKDSMFLTSPAPFIWL